MSGDNFNSIFSVDFESYASVSKKLGMLTDQIKNDKASKVKLNFDTDIINKAIGDLSKLTSQQINILPNGQIKVISQMNDELGKTIKLTQNLTTGKQGISIDNKGELKQIEETNKMYSKMYKDREIEAKRSGDEANRIMQQNYKAEQDLINQMADGREKSEAKRINDIKKLEAAQTAASNKELENSKLEEENAKQLIKIEQEKLRIKQKSIELSRQGLINEPYSNKIKSGIDSMDARTIEEARKQVQMYSTELRKLDQQARMEGVRIGSKNISTMGDAFKNAAMSLGIFVTSAMVFNEIGKTVRDSVQYIMELDKAMIDLKKVTSETSNTYKEFLNTAHDLALDFGSQSDKVVQAVTSWSKTGESLANATKLAENTMLLSKVGDIPDVAQAQKYMIAPIKAFRIETEKSIDLIDKYNNISNNTATETRDMGEGLSRAASSMALAGNSLDETLALISSAQSQTQLGGEVVGSALKTISLRLASFKDDETGEPIMKLEENLKNVGVQATNTAGEVRSTFDILYDLSKNFKNLDKNSQLMLSEDIGGKRQANIVAAILSDTEELDRAFQLAQNSAGSAMEEFKTYQEGIEYSVDILKEQINGLYTTLVSSDALKGATDISADIVGGFTSVINTLGLLPSVITAVVVGMTLFNSKFRESTQMMIGFSPSLNNIMNGLNGMNSKFKETSEKLKGQISQLKTYTLEYQRAGMSTTAFGAKLASLNMQLALNTVKIIATTVATVAFQAVLSMGLSLAIGVIIGGITKLGTSLSGTANLMDGTAQSATALANSLKEIDNDTDLVSQYKELNNKLKDANNTAEEQMQIQTEIANIKNQLSTDEAYSWIVNSNKSLEEQLDLMRQVRDEKIRNQAIELEENMPSQRKAKKEVSNLDNDIQIYNNLIKAMENVDNQGRVMFEGSNLRASDLQARINELEGNIKSSSLAIEEYNANISLMDQAGIKHNRTAIEFTEAQINTKLAIDESNASLQDSTNKLNENTDAKNSNSSAGGDTSVQTASVEALQKSYESLGYSAKEAKDRISELNSVSIDGVVIDTVPIEDATKAYGESLTKANDLQQMVDKINKSTTMSGEIVAELASKYPELGAGISSASESQDFLNNKIAEQADIQSNAMQIMYGNSESYYKAQLDNGNSLQDAFNQWASNFVDVNSEGYNFDVKNYSSLNEAKIGAMNILGDACASWLAKFTGSNAEGYSKDLQNFTTLAQQKAYVLDKLNQEIKKIENNYNSLITEANNAIRQSSGTDGASLQQEQMYARKLAKEKKKLDEIKGAYTEVETSFAQFNKSFSGVGGNFSTPTFSNGSKDKKAAKEKAAAKEKEIADVEELSDRYYDLNNALTKVENSLKDLHTEMENTDDEKKMQLLKQEVKLLSDKKIALENLRKEQQKQLSEERKALSNSGFNFGSDGSITNAKARLDALTTKANSLTGEDKENAIAEVKNLAAIVKSYTDMLLNTIPKITDDINDMKNETISAQKEIANIVAKQRDEYIKGLEKETGKLKDELDKRKKLMNDQWQNEDREDSLKEKQSNLNDLEEQLALAMRTADEELIKSIRQQIIAAQSEVDNFIRDNERDDANDRFDKESEKLDEDLQNKIDKITLQLSDEEILKMVQSGVTDLSKVLNDITSSTSRMTGTFTGIGKIIEENWIGSLSKFMSGLDSMKNFAMNMSFTPSAVNFDGIGGKAVTVSTGDLIIQGNVAEDILPKLNKMFEANNKQIIKTINDAIRN